MSTAVMRTRRSVSPILRNGGFHFPAGYEKRRLRRFNAPVWRDRRLAAFQTRLVERSVSLDADGGRAGVGNETENGGDVGDDRTAIVFSRCSPLDAV